MMMINQTGLYLHKCSLDQRLFQSQPPSLPSELDALTADYHCKVKTSRMQAMHRCRLMEGNALHQVCDTCIDVCSFTEEAAIASRTLTTKQLTLTLFTAPMPAKVSLPNNLPQRCRMLCPS